MDTARTGLEKLKDDVVDAGHEIAHRVGAAGEQAKRDVAGDDMSAGDNVKSHVNQFVNSTQADVSATKRDVRHADDTTGGVS